MATNDFSSSVVDLAKLRRNEKKYYLTMKKMAKREVDLLQKLKVKKQESELNAQDIEELQRDLRSLSSTQPTDTTEEDQVLIAEMKENIRQINILRKLKNSRLYNLLDEL